VNRFISSIKINIFKFKCIGEKTRINNKKSQTKALLLKKIKNKLKNLKILL
jgi:hypothetical protein